MRVLVTGSRQFGSQEIIYRELDAAHTAWEASADYLNAPFVVVHGGAPGADAVAGQWCHDRRGLSRPPTQEVHPANWAQYGGRAGPIRNHLMVRKGADLVLAFFWPGAGNVGTRQCVEEARRWLEFNGTTIKEVWPNG